MGVHILLKQQHYDPAIHNRRSVRQPAYDYSSDGAYFVTICLQERQPLLESPELRQILEDIWTSLPQRFPGILLDEFIIMPDHMHFIIWLHPEGENRPALGDVVRAYKSLTGRAALNYLRMQKQICGNHFWQRSYYYHVIRSESELNEKRTYIRNNPIKEDLKNNRI